MSAAVSAVASKAVDFDPDTLLRVTDLARSFGETRALRQCSLEVRRQEVHALVGENGSGKSTLVKILSGVLAAEAGEVVLAGAPIRPRNPSEAQRAGIVTVFQETLVVEEMSVADNVLLGLDGVFRYGERSGEEVRWVLERLGVGSVDLETPLWRLPLGKRQLVTVARALVRPWTILILDEATSALDIQDRDRLFEVLSEERSRGAAILFISHRMEEIQRLADRVTILRSGLSLGTFAAAEAPPDLVLRLAAGVDEGERTPARVATRRTPHTADAPPVLRVRNAVPDGGAGTHLEIAAGEILGITGLEGHGQVRFLETLVGLRDPLHGAVELIEGDRSVPIRDFHGAARHGVIYVPRDRKTEGILPTRSVSDNVIVSILGRLSSLGVLRSGRVNAVVSRSVERLRIVTSGGGMGIMQLSGGNQQKVVLARALTLEPRVLVLNDPLRGVDHTAKQEIYDLFRELAGNGVALVILSTEVEELLILCDRVGVFREEQLFAMLEGEALMQETVVASMFGRLDLRPGDAAQ